MTAQLRHFSLEICSAILEPMVLAQEQRSSNDMFSAKTNYWDSRF